MSYQIHKGIGHRVLNHFLTKIWRQHPPIQHRFTVHQSNYTDFVEKELTLSLGKVSDNKTNNRKPWHPQYNLTHVKGPRTTRCLVQYLRSWEEHPVPPFTMLLMTIPNNHQKAMLWFHYAVYKFRDLIWMHYGCFNPRAAVLENYSCDPKNHRVVKES